MNKTLRLKIIEHHGSQADFAKAVGADEAKVSRVIHDRRVLRPTEQKVWARALKCEPHEILGSMDSLLTAKDLTRILKCSAAYVYKLADLGKLPAVWLPGCPTPDGKRGKRVVRFERAAVLKFIDDHRQHSR